MEVIHVGAVESPFFSKGGYVSSVPVLLGVTHVVGPDLLFSDEVGDSFAVPYLHGIPTDPDPDPFESRPPTQEVKHTVRRSNAYIVKLALRTVPSPGTLLLVFSSSTLSLGIAFRGRPGPRPRFRERELRAMMREAGSLLEAAEVLEI